MPRKPRSAVRDDLQYRELVEVSQGLICRHDLRGKVLYTSPAAAHQLGFEPHELIGRDIRDGLARSVAHLFDAYLERIRTQGTDHGLLRLRKRDGEERLWFYRNQLVTVRPPNWSASPPAIRAGVP
ncbi:MAG: PAS domain-containing protein [Gemmatimonadales bacterium]